MIVINLYGGPGTGKTTCAAHLFALMKRAKYRVEYVAEYAKGVVWEGRTDVLTDQLYILAKQNRMFLRLEGKVDIAITDSPLLLSHVYGAHLSEAFHQVVEDCYIRFDNFNIMLNRIKPYEAYGRTQSEEAAHVLDEQIYQMLEQYSHDPWMQIDADEYAPDLILTALKQVRRINEMCMR